MAHLKGEVYANHRITALSNNKRIGGISAMRTQNEITFVTDDDVGIETIIHLLETAGVGDIKVRSQPHYGDWLESLPKDSLPGLSETCLGWIRHWGIGGGDQSSETCITNIINETGSNVPAELADAALHSVSGYCKSEFEAENLIMSMVDESIADLPA
jgi:hypothetical protein